jgi:hypothetical protein
MVKVMTRFYHDPTRLTKGSWLSCGKSLPSLHRSTMSALTSCPMVSCERACLHTTVLPENLEYDGGLSTCKLASTIGILQLDERGSRAWKPSQCRGWFAPPLFAAHMLVTSLDFNAVNLHSGLHIELREPNPSLICLCFRYLYGPLTRCGVTVSHRPQIVTIYHCYHI